MSEFRIHHDVNELLSLLHVRGGDGAEGYIDLLQKHRTPYVTTTVSAHSAKVGNTCLNTAFLKHRSPGKIDITGQVKDHTDLRTRIIGYALFHRTITIYHRKNERILTMVFMLFLGQIS